MNFNLLKRIDKVTPLLEMDFCEGRRTLKEVKDWHGARFTAGHLLLELRQEYEELWEKYKQLGWEHKDRRR